MKGWSQEQEEKGRLLQVPMGLEVEVKGTHAVIAEAIFF